MAAGSVDSDHHYFRARKLLNLGSCGIRELSGCFKSLML